MISFQWKDQFYIGGQLENVVVTLTYGDYNHGNYSIVENNLKCNNSECDFFVSV